MLVAVIPTYPVTVIPTQPHRCHPEHPRSGWRELLHTACRNRSRLTQRKGYATVVACMRVRRRARAHMRVTPACERTYTHTRVVRADQLLYCLTRLMPSAARVPTAPESRYAPSQARPNSAHSHSATSGANAAPISQARSAVSAAPV